MTELQQAFDQALAQIKAAEGIQSPSNAVKLELYAHYKQATSGDVCGKKPGMTDLVGKAKYAAWAKLKGQSQEEAMQAYLRIFESLKS